MRTLRSIQYFLLALVILAVPATSRAQFSASITIAPPELVVYTQPICPQEGYLWTPGYWAYGDEGYFWVRGTWVEPPSEGLLWTPGYWGWNDGAYAWNGVPAQMVDATLARSLLAGVSNPNVFL